MLALLPDETYVLVDDVIKVYRLLRNQKGFERWSVMKQELLVLSASLTAGGYIDNEKTYSLQTSLSPSLIDIIVAEHIANSQAAVTTSS